MKKAVQNAHERMKSIAQSVRKDGWYNVVTGLGTKAKDKRLGMQVDWYPLQEQEVDHIYAADDIARKVIDIPANEATRNWMSIRVPEENGGQDLSSSMMDELDRIKAKAMFNKAMKWSRLYGGAGIFVAAKDGKDIIEPLEINRLQNIESLTVLSRWELNAGSITRDITSKNFGLPEYYFLNPRTGQGANQPTVHHSRILRFPGLELPRIFHEQNDYWGDSELTKLLNVLRNFNSSHDSVASTIQDFRISVLKLKYLADMVASDDDQAVVDRVQLMNLTKTINNCIVLDAENEEFSHQTMQLTGVKDVLGAINDRLVAATGLPHTVILGEGSTGSLSGAGESEDKDFKKYIAQEQERMLTPPMERLLELIQLSKKGPSKGSIIESMTWDWNDLSEPNPEKEAETRYKTAQADAIYLDRGVLDPDEVAASRFGGDEYSIETKIDLDARSEQNNARQTPPEENDDA